MNPVVTFTMENGGVIKAELYPEKAPNTVNNFISLKVNILGDLLKIGKQTANSLYRLSFGSRYLCD